MRAVFAIAASTLLFVNAEKTSQELHETAKELAHRPVDETAVAKIMEDTGLDGEQFDELVLDYLEEIIMDLPGEMFIKATQYALKEKIGEVGDLSLIMLGEINELVEGLRKILKTLEGPSAAPAKPPQGIRSSAAAEAPAAQACDVFGCTCQGMSDTYGVHAYVGWGTAQEDPQWPMLKKFWDENECETVPAKACAVFGCTCQGLSDTFGIHAHVGWGSAQQSPLWAMLEEFWHVNKCETAPGCDVFGCTCQGMSDTYGVHAHVTWGIAPQDPKWPMLEKFWHESGCETAPTKACAVFGCTCQGMSNTYGVHAHVGWGTAQEDPQWPMLKKFWDENLCETVPSCEIFGCTCQGFSNKYGTNHGVTWGTAQDQPEWPMLAQFWDENKCETAPETAPARWELVDNTQPTTVLTYTGSEHGCSTAHQQCYWKTETEAKKECAQWAECQALYCTDRHLPASAGNPVCWARSAGGQIAEEGSTTWLKTAGRRRMIAEEKRRRFIGISSAALICGMTGCHRHFPWWG